MLVDSSPNFSFSFFQPGPNPEHLEDSDDSEVFTPLNIVLIASITIVSLTLMWTCFCLNWRQRPKTTPLGSGSKLIQANVATTANRMAFRRLDEEIDQDLEQRQDHHEEDLGLEAIQLRSHFFSGNPKDAMIVIDAKNGTAMSKLKQ